MKEIYDIHVRCGKLRFGNFKRYCNVIIIKKKTIYIIIQMCFTQLLFYTRSPWLIFPYSVMYPFAYTIHI